jgi:hypothetical protein
VIFAVKQARDVCGKAGWLDVGLNRFFQNLSYRTSCPQTGWARFEIAPFLSHLYL